MSRPTRVTDLSVTLLRRGYDALPSLWAGRPGDAERDATWTRLLGRRTLVVRGGHGARFFYDEDVVRRRDAVPPPLALLLFGPGAVHSLDDADHRDRKAVFLGALDAAEVERFGDLVDTALVHEVASWRTACGRGAAVSVFETLSRAYAGAALEWAGLQPTPRERRRVSADLVAMVDGFGFRPTAYARGWVGRVRAQRWAVEEVRAARVRDVRDGAGRTGFLEVLAHGAGRELPLGVAGTELLNVVRPTTAVAWLGTFAAYQLLRHPDLGPDLARDDAEGALARHRFAQEVRRTTPFVPALAGRVRRDHAWQDASGHRHVLREGDRVVLDVPGTDGHRGWGDPEAFRPDRFVDHEPDPFELVPQGGGYADVGHRCPGESTALTALDRTLRVLATTAWTGSTAAPDRARVPTLPARGLRVVTAGLPVHGDPDHG